MTQMDVVYIHIILPITLFVESTYAYFQYHKIQHLVHNVETFLHIHICVSFLLLFTTSTHICQRSKQKTQSRLLQVKLVKYYTP